MPNRPTLRLAHPDATEAIEQTLEAQAAITEAIEKAPLPELDAALAALARAQAAKRRGTWERTGRRRRSTDRQGRASSVVCAALVSFLVATVAGGAAPLPTSPSGKHARGQAALAERVADLGARLSNAEQVTSWVQRCISTQAVQLPSGDYALVLSKDCEARP